TQGEMNETKPTANAAITVVPTCPAAAGSISPLYVVATEIGLEAGGFEWVSRCRGRRCRPGSASTPAQRRKSDDRDAEDERSRRHEVRGEADPLRLGCR